METPLRQSSKVVPLLIIVVVMLAIGVGIYAGLKPERPVLKPTNRNAAIVNTNQNANASSQKVNTHFNINVNNQEIDQSNKGTVAEEISILPDIGKKLIVFKPKELSKNYSLYIFSAGEAQEKMIKTEINNYEAKDFILVDDKIYYFSWGKRVIKVMDMNGVIKELLFTKADDKFDLGSFIISKDGSQIAWEESWSTDDRYESRVYLANLLTGEKSMVFKEEFNTPRLIKLIQWGPTMNELFFSKEPSGIGGYIIFGGFSNLYKLNTSTGGVSDNLFPSTSGYTYGTDIYNNKIVALWLKNNEKLPILYLSNVDMGSNTKFVVNNNEGFTGGGNAKISPDGSRVVFNIAHWNPDDEYYRTMLYNISDQSIRILGDYPNDYFKAEQWMNNNVFVQYQRGEVQFMNLDGDIIRKITE